jgi:hypothetical protein
MTGRAKLVVATIGASWGCLAILAGLAVLAHQLLVWTSTGHWKAVPLMVALEYPLVGRSLPGWITEWLRVGHAGTIPGLITATLEALPASGFLVGTGAVILWRVSRWI